MYPPRKPLQRCYFIACAHIRAGHHSYITIFRWCKHVLLFQNHKTDTSQIFETQSGIRIGGPIAKMYFNLVNMHFFGKWCIILGVRFPRCHSCC